MILGLGISTPEITLGKDAVKAPALKGLKEGQVVRAKVLATLSGSKAQLLISGQKVTAEAQVPLTPGQDVNLKFIREKGLATFKLVPSPSPAGSKEGALSLGGSRSAITLDGEDADAPALKGLKEGQVIRAKVLGMLSGSKAQLLINGQKLTADTGQPLPPGQDISLKLTQKGLVTFKPVQSVSDPNDAAGPRTVGAKAPEAPEITLSKEAVKDLALSELKEGQPVRAKVLGMLSGSKAQLLIAGRRLAADTSQPLPPGRELTLRLIRDSDSLSFKPLSLPQDSGIKEGVSLARMAEGMLALEKLGQEPGKILSQVIENLALKSGVRDDGFLQRLMSNSGMQMEQKIATLAVSTDGTPPDVSMQKLAHEDMKAALLSLITRESDGHKGSSDKSPSAELLRTAASALESFQSLNAQPAESQRFIIPFPVIDGNQFNFGQLFMDTGKKDEGNDRDPENRVIRLAFLLNMTSLGDLRADFSILQKNITGRFLLEDQSTCDYIESLMPDLNKRLSGVGFLMGRVDCVVAEPSQLSPGALIQAMGAKKEVRGLDLVI